MKTFKHKTNGSIMTYKDGCMMVDRVVIEGTPDLNYWEEVISKEEIMQECIKRFPKGSLVKSACNGTSYRIAKEYTNLKGNNRVEGVYYYGVGTDILAMIEGRDIGFYLYHKGKYAELIEDPLFTTENGIEIFMGDTFWNVDLFFHLNVYQVTNNLYKLIFLKDGSKQFSTKEKAEEYIHRNKKQFSLVDIESAFSKADWHKIVQNSVTKHLISAKN